MADRKVRTTFRPDVEIEVGDAEYADLAAQGLIAPNAKAEPVAAPKTPVAPPAPGDPKTEKKPKDQE